MSMDKLNYAVRTREVFKRIAAEVVEKMRPGPRRGTVMTQDLVAGTVGVKYPDEAPTFDVKAGLLMPEVGAIVRVGGPDGARYISAILSGGVKINGNLAVTGSTTLTGGGATGPAGPQGPDGESAYEVALANGFVGTEAAWLASLVGPTGATGATGATGGVTGDVLDTVRRTRTTTAAARTTTTLADDDTLVTGTLPASSVWQFSLDLRIIGTDASDVKIALTVPSGASGIYEAVGVATAATSAAAASIKLGGSTTITTTFVSGTMAADSVPLRVFGTLTIGATPGPLTLQWACNTADATGVQMGSGSRLNLDRVA